MELDNLKKNLKLLLSFYNVFKALSDSYIIEYFTNNHWNKLPSRWQTVLHELDPPDIAHKLLSTPGDGARCSGVWPLSLLAFKQCCHSLPLTRTRCTNTNRSAVPSNEEQSNVMKHIFRKHVKPKKQHEITELAKTIDERFRSSSCDAVVDMGSGRGHLARALSFGYGIPVVAVECNADLLKMAAKFDDEASCTLSKCLKRSGSEEVKLPDTPCHVEYSVPVDVSPSAFVGKLREHSIPHRDSNPRPRYLLTGLHACGDLSAAMIRLFRESDDITAVVSVACCYMKLTTSCGGPGPTAETTVSYPMSKWLRSVKNSDLPYKSREASCHAIEDYKARLLENGRQLRVHCYRAVLESIIRREYPDMVRAPVQTIKKSYNLPFVKYAEKAFEKLGRPCPDFSSFDVDSLLGQWKNVVVYFTLCLMLAPTVESIILLDRMIYLREDGLKCEIVSLFEPILSPRCFAIVASKSETG